MVGGKSDEEREKEQEDCIAGIHISPHDNFTESLSQDSSATIKFCENKFGGQIKQIYIMKSL